MAEAIVSALLDNLTSTVFEKIDHEVSLVVGADEELEQLKSKLGAIKAVLLDAEQKQVKEEAIRHWLQRLKDASYDVEDVLEDWNAAMLKFQHEGNGDGSHNKNKVCCFFPPSCFGIKQVVFCHEIAHRIKDLNKRLDSIAREKDMFNLTVNRSIEKQERKETTSFDVDLSEICGRDIEKEILLHKLFSGSSSEGLHIMSLVGMGGIGKTTLAQFIYHNEHVKNHFKQRIWVCVSDPFDQCNIAKTILETLEVDASNINTLNNLLEKVEESVRGEIFFLVLDDVWLEEENKWKPLYNCLKHGHRESRILVTTRKKEVAYNMKSKDIITVEELSKESCRMLFRQIAFYGWSNGESENVEEIVEEIVNKCKGLPLAIKTIGSLLHSKKNIEDWKLILYSEMWELEELEKGIFPPLLLSYYDLSPMIKSCFLYCAIFPKDWEFERYTLIYLWMAQGYLESDESKMQKIGEKYFDILVARSLIIKDDNSVFSNSYKMHDIIHDVALFLSQNECCAIIDNGFEVPQIIDRTRHLTFISRVNRGSPFPSDFHNPKRLRSLLIRDRTKWMEGTNTTEECCDVPTKFFHQFSYLKSLSLCLDNIKEIPEDIGKLIHLKFLDLHGCSKISKLPDSLWELYNLQTLRINHDIYTEGIGKLINLRHLIIYTYGRRMDPTPKQIETLTGLQTLNTFVVGAGNLESLRNLNNLRGRLVITELEKSIEVNEIKKAQLEEKKDLGALALKFVNNMFSEPQTSKEYHEKILQAFEPPPNIESLWVENYQGGIELPDGIMSLRRLKTLTLWNCYNFECLPPLGKLPFLESLDIDWMRSVKRVSKELLGIESGAASSSSSSKIVVFPKLKHLRLSVMHKWEEWGYGITKKDEEHITIMPCLSSLYIGHCSSLKVLPEDFYLRTKLEKFETKESSPIVREQYKKWKEIKQIQDSDDQISNSSEKMDPDDQIGNDVVADDEISNFEKS